MYQEEFQKRLIILTLLFVLTSCAFTPSAKKLSGTLYDVWPCSVSGCGSGVQPIPECLTNPRWMCAVDFENITNAALDKNVVNYFLGANKIPTLDSADHVTVRNRNQFSYWYTQLYPVFNIPFPYDIILSNNGTGSPTVFSFSSDSFFPLDNRGFGNQEKNHNYGFTFAYHGAFTYLGTEFFQYYGDDDFFLFINNRLAIDLGGSHPAQNASIDLTWPRSGCSNSSNLACNSGLSGPCACNLRLDIGKVYTIDIFFNERHTPDSIVSIKTSIDFQCPFYDFCGVCQGDGQSCCRQTCDDNNACTTDRCHPITGECTHEPLCKSSDKCTEATCINGACAGSPVICSQSKCSSNFCNSTLGCIEKDLNCDDSNPCTIDSCDLAIGCQHLNINCDDSNLCTKDYCDRGLCINSPVPCPADLCSTATCAPTIGCIYSPINCVGNDDKCFNYTCNTSIGCVSSPWNCNDNNLCTVDSCAPNVGCQHTLIICDDGLSETDDFCDQDYGCQYVPHPCEPSHACETVELVGNVCVRTNVTCNAKAKCTVPICDIKYGCQYLPRNCDDGNACTVDSCNVTIGCLHTAVNQLIDPCLQMFQCNATHINVGPRNCDDGNACTNDYCEMGSCGHTFITGCSQCTLCDGLSPSSPCYKLVCRNDQCIEIPSNICDDNDLCTNDTCIPQGSVSATCTNVPKCPHGDQCLNTTCNPITGNCSSSVRNCDDLNPCTIDSCNSTTGCVYNLTCSTSDACDKKFCINGQCSSFITDCDDNNFCTTDSCVTINGAAQCNYAEAACGSTNNSCLLSFCNPSTGLCETTPKNCENGDPCTTASCSNGQCIYKPLCGQDPCNPEQCNPTNGECTALPKPCATNNKCLTPSCANIGPNYNCSYTPKTCVEDPCNPITCNPLTGQCAVSGTPKNCDDADPCTDDMCVGGLCINSPKTCIDGDACTIDSCIPNVGCSNIKKQCNDSNPCTSDSCDAAVGCIFSPMNCNDGNACTYDTCSPSLGKCVYSNLTCDDFKVCTTDRCDPVLGCVFEPFVKLVSPCATMTCDEVSGFVSRPALCPENCKCDLDKGCVCTNSTVFTVVLTQATNATFNTNNSVVKIIFPESPTTNVSFGLAPSSEGFQDPTQNVPGTFVAGTTFFITFYENSSITHRPPNGTFIDIEVDSPENAYLFYFDTELNKWIQNCYDPVVYNKSLHIELCHATQYAIFNLNFEISDSAPKGTDITVIAIIIVILVIVIAGMTGAIVYYRRRIKIQKRKSRVVSEIEMENTLSLVKGAEIKHKLGGGNFGEVYQGEWKGTTVALKKLKAAEQYEEFLKESVMLSKFSHPNVVQFMKNGDLLSLVRKDYSFGMSTLIDMARQAAAGMVYLSDRNIVHRDLALRNFLVASTDEKKFVIKVSDFGLSRVISDNNYYVKEDSQLPVKWSAPESLKYGKFSVKSDVWSFGVCLWELFSKGETPYFTMTNAEAMEKVIEGYRPPQTKLCSDELYKLMLSCWKMDPMERPNFEEVLNILETIYRKDAPQQVVEMQSIIDSQDVYYN